MRLRDSSTIFRKRGECLAAMVLSSKRIVGDAASRHYCENNAADTPWKPTSGETMPFFPEIDKIRYEGPDSTNALSYRHYNADEKVEGKSMREHLRFAVCYWHTFRGMGGDPFGPGCAKRPWEDGSDSVDMALKRVDVAFEFMEKLGVPFYCFHDRDVAPEGKNLAETNKNLDAVARKLKDAQNRT